MSAADVDADRALKDTMALGSQAAIAALESMLGQPALQLGAPQIAPSDLGVWAPPAQTGWVVSVPLQQGAPVAWAVALEEDAARVVVERLLKQPFTSWDELTQSALMELGNVGACAFWGGVAQRARTAFVPGVPAAQHGALAESLHSVAQHVQAPRAVWAACGNAATGQGWQATLWLIVEQRTLSTP